MDLNNYISSYNLEQIIKIEESDRQFLSLKKSWGKIEKKYGNDRLNKNIFLFLILQNSIISYQISGSGELWREEFGQKIFKDFSILKETILNKVNNTKWRYYFLISSKYNKRIYNLKTKRLIKFEEIKSDLSFFEENFSFLEYYENMEILFEIIKKRLKSDGKTVCFAIKMFGYGARIVYNKFYYYPYTIKIPIDSRLKKIYSQQKTQIDIKTYFDILTKKHNIPALHLDSLLRIDYRNKTKFDTKNQQKTNKK